MFLSLSRRQAMSSAVGLGAVACPAFASALTQADASTPGDATALAEAVDVYVKRAMAAFPDQPAISIAVVKDGRTVLARGYGVRKMGEAQTVDEHTLFAIASNTKNVTAAALAMMVDEGRVKWDEPVRTYLPDFRLSDPYISEHITVRDTLSHRAGFGLGAGDLLFWPNSDRTREEVVAQAAFVPIEDGFRANYHYCNLMFVVAGQVLAAASGMRWEEFVQKRIFDRVGMTGTVPMATLADPAKSALPHARVGPPLRTHGPMTLIAESIAEVWNWDSAAAAGGICTNPVDWAKWINVRLAMGKLPDGSRLFSESVAREMWKPNIIISGTEGPTAAMPGRAIASTYAMGYQVQDYRGERYISHGGGSPGGISATVMIPGRNVGFSIFSNAEEGMLLRSLRSGIADLCMGPDRSGADFDWITDSLRLAAEAETRAIAAAAGIAAKQAQGARPSLPLEAYAGTWRDPWYGDITIQSQDGGLWLAFTHTSALKGVLEPYDGETMRTRFGDKREEDLLITFALVDGQPATATMKALSPDADFSYDYQDLRLTRV
ncbi:MAG TPA: serine hydrolase [Brevundimonas sp.]|jgi:CubicO group peptidase (beta-lactamase class C family)